jgi:hypothetical protein
MPLQLTIDRLILDGISLRPDAIPILQAALESELALLLGTGSLPLSADLNLAGLRAGAISLPPGNDPAQLGAQIARSLYGSLGGQPVGWSAPDTTGPRAKE